MAVTRGTTIDPKKQNYYNQLDAYQKEEAAKKKDINPWDNLKKASNAWGPTATLADNSYLSNNGYGEGAYYGADLTKYGPTHISNPMTNEQIHEQLAKLQAELDDPATDRYRAEELRREMANYNRLADGVRYTNGDPTATQINYEQGQNISRIKTADGNEINAPLSLEEIGPWLYEHSADFSTDGIYTINGVDYTYNPETQHLNEVRYTENRDKSGEGGQTGEGEGLSPEDLAKLQYIYGDSAFLQGVSENTRKMLEQYGQGYTPGQGVTDLEEALKTLMDAKPGDYEQSQKVQDAYKALQDILNNKPGDYQQSGKVQEAYKALQDILNAKPGDYEQSQQVKEAFKTLQNLLDNKPGEYQQSQELLDAISELANLKQQKPGEYQESQDVIDARAAWEALQGQKPQGYNSKYEAQLTELLNKIQNPEKFNYELNSDNLYKAYADYYQEMGRQANANAQGQAASMTGGYGNSWAQSVGQQQNQQYLLQMNDKALELRDRAYQEWLQEQQNNKDLYSILQNADATDYGRYRDDVGDWQYQDTAARNWMYNQQTLDIQKYQNEFNNWLQQMGMAEDEVNSLRNYDLDRYNTMFNKWLQETGLAQEQAWKLYSQDYGQYRDKVSDWYNSADMANQNYWNEQNFDYGQYRDKVSDWYNSADMANQNYWNEQNFDYGKYIDTRNQWNTDVDRATQNLWNGKSMDWQQYETMLNYYTGLAQIENQAYTSEQERQEAIRQYNQNFAENQRQFNANLQYGYAGLENQRSIASMNNSTSASIAAAQLAENQRQFDANLAYKQSADEYNRMLDERNYQLQLDNLDYNRTLDDRDYQLKIDQLNYNRSVDEYNQLMQQDQLNYNRSMDQYNQDMDSRDYNYKLAMQSIGQGIVPDDGVLQAAGMSRGYAEALAATYAPTASSPTSNPGDTNYTPKIYYASSSPNGDHYYQIVNGQIVDADPNMITPYDTILPAMSPKNMNPTNQKSKWLE